MTRGRLAWAAGLVGAALALDPAVAAAAPQRFVVVSGESRVEFVSGTQLGEFRGRSTALAGEILYDPDDPGRSRLTVSVDPRTLASDNAARDKHMHERLLEVERFASITLAAAGFRPADGAAGTVAGTLALHGVARPVAVPVRFVRVGQALRGEARFEVALADFGMAPPRLLGLKVRDTVTVEVRLVAVQA